MVEFNKNLNSKIIKLSIKRVIYIVMIIPANYAEKFVYIQIQITRLQINNIIMMVNLSNSSSIIVMVN